MTDTILAFLCGALVALSILRVLWRRRQARWGFEYQRKSQ